MIQYFSNSHLGDATIASIPFLFNPESNKLLLTASNDGIQIKKSDDLYKIFWNRWDHKCIERQQNYMVLYFRNERILGISLESIGNKEQMIIDTQRQLERIILLNATGVASAYNHSKQSTVLKPSIGGLSLFVYCRELFYKKDIKYYDHIILNHEKDKYYSFKKVGLL